MAVFRRGKLWWFDFRFAGIRIRESTGARTRAQALQAEAIRKGELARGRGRLERPEPLPRFVDFASGEFANWCANEHRDRPSTFARYMRSVKALSEFFSGRLLDVIDAGTVEKF